MKLLLSFRDATTEQQGKLKSNKNQYELSERPLRDSKSLQTKSWKAPRKGDMAEIRNQKKIQSA